MDTYLLDYNPVLLYFAVQIVPALMVESSLSVPQSAFDLLSSVCCYWMLFESFLNFLPSSRISHFPQDS